MLLVFGPRSLDYDFGPGHPLTPRRFGPGIDLLRAVGATPGLAPEPASDEELQWCHDPAYIEAVKRFSVDPYGFPEAGIGDGGDCPPFAGMHETSAAVAGGSIRAVEAILRGDVEHAQHPGGGLHHAMAARASGFCIYDDPALAIARARRDGLRVLYLDFDVHHGDGVQALHWADPGVMTCSFHESGRTLFPGSGFPDEVGAGVAAGTAVNVPLPAGTGEGAWLAAVSSIVPELAASFGPDLIVSQHGADAHAWDPLANLRVTTTAMGAAARLVDAMAHRYAGGRWLATNGGGYDAYRVVPRAWALTWLAGAHREVPAETPVSWRERWADEAARYGQAPLPTTFDDLPRAGEPPDPGQATIDGRATATAEAVRGWLVPRIVREARDRGWWVSDGEAAGTASGMPSAPPPDPGREPTIRASLTRDDWARLALAPRVVSAADAGEAHGWLARTLDDGAQLTAAVAGATVVGLVATIDTEDGERRELLALGVAPDWRRRGIATALLAAAGDATPGGLANGGADPRPVATLTLAERDVFDPLDGRLRIDIGRRLLERAGFQVEVDVP
ncbi:MAG TPA: GNAT family N-acetyltransferase [Candidatus Saccharimonadales bacterium]|nr:GNAT family N-acetyltransferase [Candidatus Saccharimonadales bacterium]